MNCISNGSKYIEMIEKDDNLIRQWKKYQEKYEYANKITFEDCIKAIKIINEVMILIAV